MTHIRALRHLVLVLVFALISIDLAQAQGRVAPKWQISGFSGPCGGGPVANFLETRFGFLTKDDAITEALRAWQAAGCGISNLQIVENYPGVTLLPNGNPGGIPDAIGIGATCEVTRGALSSGYGPSVSGVCETAAFSRTSADKNRCEQCGVGSPINPAFWNKLLTATDYQGAGPFPLRFERTYNSSLGRKEGIGVSWTHSYSNRLYLDPARPTIATVTRPRGGAFAFFSADGGSTYVADPDQPNLLARVLDSGGQLVGWRLQVADGDVVEDYDASGKLTRITDRQGLRHTLAYSDGTSNPGTGGTVEGGATPLPAGLLIRVEHEFGRTLTFGYDANKRIVRMTDPAAANYLYGYSANGTLTSVGFSGSAIRQYHYGEAALSGSQPNALTGITDENGQRTANYYFLSFMRPNSTRRVANGVEVERYDVGVFDPGLTTVVVDPLGATRTYGYANVLGRLALQNIAGPACPACGPLDILYDSNGFVRSRRDWNANRTCFTHNPRGLEELRVEGLPSAATCPFTGALTAPARKITTEWHATFHLPTRIAEPLRIATLSYDAAGNLLSRSIQPTSDANGSLGFGAAPAGAPRAWSYTYNASGQVLTADGPRTDVADVTTYTYDAQGNVATITNAAGHVTSITAYNAHGQPITIVDPNGLSTTLAYDSRMRLTSRTVGTEATSYEYDGVGQLTKVTLPDGSFLSYSYDSAHRLTGMQDNLGNRIAYALDAMGNRTQEQVFDPGNNLAQTRSRVYSSLNRLFRELGAAGQTTEYGYDNQGNVTSVKDPLNRTTSNQYDALNRLKQVTDPALGVTQYGYNGLDALTQVSDPRSLVTGYTVDGLGNLAQQNSPDTGATVNTYDAAGNLLTQADAKGQLTSYAYDALNRVGSITFADGAKQTYAYDQGPNGLGRLSSIEELNPAQQLTARIAYGYDPLGRVTSEARTVGGQSYPLAYTYDASGRMSGMAYPSGRTVSYGFDALGRVNQVTTTRDNQSQVVVQNVAYHPFGGVKSFTLGNGQFSARAIDLDGRIAAYSLGGASYTINFDAASRITSIGEAGNPPNTNLYGYDALDRLSSAVLPSSSFGYGYDAVGNRLTKNVGAASDSYAYSATSNRIASITPASGPVRNFVFDANGSSTADGLNTYAYDTRGRMVQATSTVGATSYQVNALGQRVRKTNSTDDRVFHYDTRGRLIAETDAGGSLKREYLYLEDVPVGVVQ